MWMRLLGAFGRGIESSRGFGGDDVSFVMAGVWDSVAIFVSFSFVAGSQCLFVKVGDWRERWCWGIKYNNAGLRCGEVCSRLSCCVCRYS